VFNWALKESISRLAERVAGCEQKLSTVSSTALLVRINELEAALEALQKSNRRELGKIWRALDRDEREARPPANDQRTLDDSGDPEFDAYIRLQNAHGSS
jgi:hypothetical protein